jgi:hypothetical protein
MKRPLGDDLLEDHLPIFGVRMIELLLNEA